MKPLWIGLSVTALLALAATLTVAQGEEQNAPPLPRPLDFTPFEQALAGLTAERIAELNPLVFEATLTQLQQALTEGNVTSVELTTYYLARIRQYDVAGLRSFIELNPDALTIAAQLDAERASGTVRSVLHGIPMSLKDNIATGDQMHNTAGAAALASYRADRDSFIAARIRQAGAVILGKANMSEWAFWMSSHGSSGYTAIGGQVVSPFDPAFDPSGSSSGSAVSVSANLISVSVGSETAGSIISPAANNSLVGFHPSLGLISRDRIIPITDQTDTAGPITRTVMDAALLLNVIAGVDSNDARTVDASSLAGTDFTQFLNAEALAGKRVGFYTGATELPGVVTVAEFYQALGLSDAVAALEKTGAEVVPILSQNPDGWLQAFEVMGDYGMNVSVAEYLQATNPTGAIQSMADVVAFNEQNPTLYALHGQDLLQRSLTNTTSHEEYVVLGAQIRQEAQDYLESLFTNDNLDVIVSVNNNMSLLYSLAGCPAITVPAGLNAEKKPYGLTFTGLCLQDGAVIGYGYAFEQATHLREIPPVGKP